MYWEFASAVISGQFFVSSCFDKYKNITAYIIDKLNIYKNTLIIYFEVNNVLGGLRGVNRLLVFGYYIAIAYGIAKSVPNT